MDNITGLGKYYLKSIATKDDLMFILNKLQLSDIEYAVLDKVYKENKDLSIVSEELGYSIQYIKVVHRNALIKVSTLIKSTMRHTLR